eukprot:7562610-Pyramimonas_sp.AAC.1
MKAAKQHAQLKNEIWSWIQLWCQMCMTLAKDATIPDAQKPLLSQHVQNVKDMKALYPHVHVCFTKKCYRQKEWKKDWYRIELMVSPQLQPTLDEVVKIIGQMPEVERKVGGPARGPHARTIVECLVEMGEYKQQE